MKQRIEQWKIMEQSCDPNAEKFLHEITEQAKAEGKIDEMNEAASFLLKEVKQRIYGIAKVVNELEKLQAVIDSGITPEAYEMFNNIKTDADHKAIDNFIEANISKLSSDIEELHEVAAELSKSIGSTRLS